MKKEIKSERELILYWYYSIMSLFPIEKIDNNKINESINFLKIYHINKYKIPMRERNDLFKKKGDAYAFARLSLLIPQKYYKVDFKSALAKSIEFNRKNNEVAELGDYLSSKSTVSNIADSYEELIFVSEEDIGIWTSIELKEYHILFKFMIPDDPISRFFEFIDALPNNGLFHKRKSDSGLFSTNEDRGMEKNAYFPKRSIDKLLIRGIFSNVKEPNWKNISIELVSDSSLSIKIKGSKAKRYSYAQLGLSDRRKSDMPNHIWSFIKVLAELRGDISKKDLILDNESNSDLKARKHVEKSVSRLRKFLKELTGIDNDPFHPFNKKVGYKTKFKILDSRSEQYLDYLSNEENTS